MDNAPIMPIIMQLGSYGLRRLVGEDANPKYLKWICDPAVNAFLTVGKFPMSLDELSQYIAGFDKSKNSVAFAIIHINGDGHVGNVTLNNINWISGTADIGLMIGEKKHATSECGHTILSLLIPYGFDVLGLRRLYMGILEGNRPCLEAATQMNFVEEGRWRHHSLVHGKYQDEIWFGAMKSERENFKYFSE